MEARTTTLLFPKDQQISGLKVGIQKMLIALYLLEKKELRQIFKK
jgi:hypothetical protein